MIARRQFITLLGGAAAWPLAARAQQAAIPVMGYLAQGAPEASAGFVAAVRQGLADVGLIEGKNVASEFRWANHSADRLPGLATNLVQRRVAVIITLDTVAAARAARAVTTEIPIVFALGTDPVRAGLVTSLNRPGGNITGITTMNLDLGSKWIGLLHELLPTRLGRALRQIANHWDCRLLRPHRDRPSRGRAVKRDEVAAPDHSITSSAVASTVGGTLRPSALAVCRLIRNSNLLV